MSYVEISDRMAILLHHLTRWPLHEKDIVRLRRTPEWMQARAWGWVMESGVLTGTGNRHAGEDPDWDSPSSGLSGNHAA